MPVAAYVDAINAIVQFCLIFFHFPLPNHLIFSHRPRILRLHRTIFMFGALLLKKKPNSNQKIYVRLLLMNRNNISFRFIIFISFK